MTFAAAAAGDACDGDGHTFAQVLHRLLHLVRVRVRVKVRARVRVRVRDRVRASG